MVACPRCGRDFWPWADGVSHARKFCSSKCGQRIVTPKPKPLPHFFGRFCLWCLIYFETKTKRQACCTSACRTMIEVRRRKLRLRGLNTQVIPLARIYQRDHGRCGLCQQPVDRAFKYPHPGSATLDHIVPITRGGLHADENVQLAHARCNLAKGNRPCGSQLRFLA